MGSDFKLNNKNMDLLNIPVGFATEYFCSESYTSRARLQGSKYSLENYVQNIIVAHMSSVTQVRVSFFQIQRKNEKPYDVRVDVKKRRGQCTVILHAKQG